MKHIITRNSLLFFLILASCIFYESINTYRYLVFNIVPFDDYADYLIYLASLGDHGILPNSPQRERILSLLAYVPFYYIAPPFTFTNAPPTNPLLLKGYLALALGNAMFLIGSILTMAFLLKKINVGSNQRMLALLYFFIGMTMIVPTGIDFVAMLVLSLILCQLIIGKKPYLSLPFIFLPFVNEKLILFLLPLCAVLSVRDRALRVPSLVLLAAFVFYIAIRIHYGVGAEDQVRVSSFMDSLISTLRANLVFKGVFLFAFPLLYVLAPLLYWREEGSKMEYLAFSLGVFVLLVSALIADVKLNIGRIVEYSLPYATYLIGTRVKVRQNGWCC